MSSEDALGGYEPRKYNIPSLKDAFLKCYITDPNKYFSKEAMDLLNRRAYRWIINAALYAYATMNAVIAFYPDRDRKYVEPILEELSKIVNEDIYLHLGPEDNWFALDSRTDKAADAVGHAGNIFNNTALLLPVSVRKAVLEARDLCDEAVRQPRLISHTPT
jgi:hypothetical protein